MAEAAGLALGGISLMSLFSSCVDIIEYFEHGRNWIYDFSLAMTKVNLMKLRLSQLGDSTSSNETYINWQQGDCSIPDGLLGITKILGRTTELCRRYSYSLDQEPTNEISNCTSMRGIIMNHPSTPDSAVFNQLLPPKRSISTLKKKIWWAVHDKRKFEGLLTDFESILSNLEKIAEGFENCEPARQHSCSKQSILHILNLVHF